MHRETYGFRGNHRIRGRIRGSHKIRVSHRIKSIPGSSDGKESDYNAGDLGSIPVLGRSPGDGKGNLLQYCCLEDSVDRGAWQTTVLGVTELDMTD